MLPVLILQHQLPENAAYLTTWLERNAIDYCVFNAGAGEQFPSSIEPYSALAVMGGGMSANDALISNRQAEILILQAMRLNRPVIGHCLGGQLMSRALGARITASPRPEIGWLPIEYENLTTASEWFGPEPTDTVAQWHYESFGIPAGAVRVATSAACPNQAWAMGPHLAMQFHIEINEAKMINWVTEDDAKWAENRQLHESVQDKITMLNGINFYLEKHQRTADRIYSRWLAPTAWAVKIDK